MICDFCHQDKPFVEFVEVRDINGNCIGIDCICDACYQEHITETVLCA